MDIAGYCGLMLDPSCVLSFYHSAFLWHRPFGFHWCIFHRLFFSHLLEPLLPAFSKTQRCGRLWLQLFLALFNPLNFCVDSSIIFLMGPFPPGLTFVIFLTLLVAWFHPFALSYLLAWKPCILLMQASHTVEHAVSLLHLQCFLVDIQMLF